MKLQIASLTLALASLASVPAFAGGFDNAYPRTPVARPAPVATVVAQPVMGRRDARDGIFLAQLRARVNQVDARVRAGVARGRIAPRAISVVGRQSAQIERAIHRAERNGAVGPREARQLDAMVSQLERVPAQFRARNARYSRR